MMVLFTRTLRPALSGTRSIPFRPAPIASITTVSHTLEPGNVPDPLLHSTHTSKDLAQKVDAQSSLPQAAAPPAPPTVPHARKDAVASHITPSIKELLPLLRSQPAHYITAHIHGHPYLVTAGDTIRLPFLMPHVQAGDVLRLNRATHIGSRDYTLKAPEPVKGVLGSRKTGYGDQKKVVQYLDERLFRVRATVMGIESEPMRVIEKTKRRRRHTRHVYSKHKYTVLRVGEVEVKSLEEYEEALKEGKA